MLFVVQVFIILFSICTFKKRKFQEGASVYNVSILKYFVVSSTFALVAFGFDLILEFNSIKYSMFYPVFGHNESCQVLDKILLYKKVTDVMTLVTTILLFSAMSTLVPTLVWDKNEEKLDRAVDQLSYQIRWMGYYFYIAVMYLVIGGFFLITNLRWFASHFPGCNEIHSLVEGMAFYSAIFYVTLLSVIVLLIAVRFRLAASWIAEHRMRGKSERVKQKWLRDNGLTLPFARIAQNSAALLSPLLVPFLSDS